MDTVNVNNEVPFTEEEISTLADMLMATLLNDFPTDVNQREWLLPTGGSINLLTPEEFEMLPNGTELLNIFGRVKVKGTDFIDLSTNGGLIAFGLKPIPEPTVTV